MSNNLDHEVAMQSNAQSLDHGSRAITNERPCSSQPVQLLTILERWFAHLYSIPNYPLNVTDITYSYLQSIFENTPNLPESNDLSLFSTSYRRLSYFEKKGTLICPIEYPVGERIEYVRRGSILRSETVNSVAHKISLHDILLKFFSMPNILKETIDNYNELMTLDPSQSLHNVVNGSAWRAKYSNSQTITLPLFLHVDDLEILNPLGPRSGIHKLGAAYISVPCLPTKFVSKLKCIFLALLYHSNDRVVFGNEKIFKPLINQFNDLLLNGIFFNLNDFKGLVYFSLAAILGDNLGLNGIFGFVESFSAEFSCRYCKCPKSLMKKQFHEDKSLLRNLPDYLEDVEKNNWKETGIKEKCVFLNVNKFNPFSEGAFDTMHDLSHGCSRYVLSKMLVALIDKCHYFTIETFNDRLSAYRFGPDFDNKPTALKLAHLKNGNLRLSASQTDTLVKHLGVLIGDLIPLYDKYWEIYITLRKVYDFAFSKVFVPSETALFDHYVGLLCTQFIELFNETLKTKFHNLLHYNTVALQLGPLKFISSMRFEAKHFMQKLAAQASSNRLNITLTVARKHQLYLNNLFCDPSTNFLKSDVEVGKCHILSEQNADIIISRAGLPEGTKVGKITRATVLGEKYCKDFFIVWRILANGFVVFALIEELYLINDFELLLMVKPYNTLGYNEHFYAFHVAAKDQDSSFILLNNIADKQTCSSRVINENDDGNNTYVVLRNPI